MFSKVFLPFLISFQACIESTILHRGLRHSITSNNCLQLTTSYTNYTRYNIFKVVVELPDPFRAWRNSTSTPKGLDQRTKMEVVPKMARRRGSDAGQLRGVSYPAEGVRRRCMMNSPSVLSCIGKRTREGWDIFKVIFGVYHAQETFFQPIKVFYARNLEP